MSTDNTPVAGSVRLEIDHGARRGERRRPMRGDATATVIVGPAERCRVLGIFVEELNCRNDPDGPWPEAVLDEWVARSPLARVTLAETD